MYLTLIRIRKKELAVSFRCTLTREKIIEKPVIVVKGWNVDRKQINK